ncbi:kelch repeat-containing protein [Rhodothermus profundi]|uniref:FlgD Ig-like domain-containing protein n=1 Tax=Rhodothermus profundi TaxID=633813 RepID=A0A1M6UKC2_9BACT|nr:kelch repeat-containing protein [Rhodothermus profundi]SHK69593.1 FlgD Ig-like domain-containing protein [Rhodothermus profundi]
MRVLMLCSLVLIVLPVRGQVWREVPPMPTPRYAAAAAVLNGYLYVIGGIGADGALLTTVEAYDPVRRTWIRDLPHLDDPRAYAAAVVLNGRIYLIGGLEGDTLAHAEATDDVLVFHPKTGWEEVASLEEARYGLVAVAFKDRIYAIGGLSREAQMVDRVGRQPVPLNTIEVYDSQQDEWQLRARLPHAVAFAAAALLGEDIYVFGGLSKNIPVALIQRFRPTTSEVTPLGATLPQVWWAGAALPYQNKIILLGGLGDRETPLPNVYAVQFMERAAEFRERPPLLQARLSFAAVVHNDTVFVFGGLNQRDGYPLRTAEAAAAAVLTPREALTLPADFELALPYPQPFREQVTLTFRVSTRLPGALVQLEVYDLLGRLVTRLLNQPLPPGQHTLFWTGLDAAGHPVPAGVYLVRLRQGPYQHERLLIRTR